MATSPHEEPQDGSVRASLQAGLAITRRSRFVVNATTTAAIQARTVARTILPLLLGDVPLLATVGQQVQSCIGELAAIASRRFQTGPLVCELWRDAGHLFTAVTVQEPLPLLPDETALGLNVVRLTADDYGSHLVDGMFQMWAAIRIA